MNLNDITGRIIRYEEGDLDNQETLELFAVLLQTGLINNLQGSYQRTAMDLIDGGYITPTGCLLDEDDDDDS
jgi:hypothetical protein